ncbi:MAG: recombination mediator RecR [Kiritimatiellae bacterium]|nr:recombination mediator RecR [Kiritimatiellia bacterium]
MIEPLERLIEVFARLPGLGRRSAERIALRLARDRSRALADELLAVLTEFRQRVAQCRMCGGVTTVEANPCTLCTDPRRDPTVLCVVEDPADIAAIEASGAFTGRYHALLGRLSAVRGEGRRHIRADELFRRVAEEHIEEVVIALDTDAESEATARWLAERLAAQRVRTTRLACGLPVGSGIAYSDPQTLEQAIRRRVPF